MQVAACFLENTAMSSIRGSLEEQLTDEEHNPPIVCQIDGGLVGLGALAKAGKEPGRVCLPDPEVTHANLTRFHWTRRAIETDEEGHTCKKALAPNGTTGCRACWVHPELGINYRSH